MSRLYNQSMAMDTPIRPQSHLRSSRKKCARPTRTPKTVSADTLSTQRRVPFRHNQFEKLREFATPARKRLSFGEKKQRARRRDQYREKKSRVSVRKGQMSGGVDKENEGSNNHASSRILTQGFRRMSLLDDDGEFERKEKKKRERLAKKKAKEIREKIRIVRSSRLFERHHSFQKLLVEPVENGSGSYLYVSKWKGNPAVTKLMPLFAIEGFNESDSIKNAEREASIHARLYERACLMYGVENACIVPQWACVRLNRIPPSAIRSILKKNEGDDATESDDIDCDVDDDDDGGDCQSESDSDECNSDDSTRSFGETPEPGRRHRRRQFAESPSHCFMAITMPKFQMSLKDFIKKYRPLTEEESDRLVRRGIQMMNVCRAENIIHNDLKNENIFVSVKGLNQRVLRSKRGRKEVIDLRMNVDSDEDEDGDDDGFIDHEARIERQERLKKYGHLKIDQFVFGDFGCSASTLEEFPFGRICGTLTMWDLEALGSRYGRENGFSVANEMYALIGCVFDGIMGKSMIGEILESMDPEYDAANWKKYTGYLRKARRRMTDTRLIQQKVIHECGICDDRIISILIQLGMSRDKRMTLDEMSSLISMDFID